MTNEAPGAPFHSTKTFSNYPCAHRQHRHTGNCALVHGYSRSFHFIFGAQTLDACGFAVDFGQLGWLKDWLAYMFDHTLLLMPDDPKLHLFEQLQAGGACAIRLMPNGVGMEGTALTVCSYTDAELRQRTKGRCWVVSVEARENDKNSAIYTNPDAGFHGWLP
jgi:6-pyruvoyltetrahydropterin/6-carboxytetrahydropterin synthase